MGKEKKLFIIEDTDKIDICLARLHQEEYARTICWANVDAFYHPDPDSQPAISNANIKILTDTEQSTVSKRQQQFTSLVRTFLEVERSKANLNLTRINI